jgi:hypothetical protein
MKEREMTVCSRARARRCEATRWLLYERRVPTVHTIASYRDTFRLLLLFAQKRLRKAPSQGQIEDPQRAIREHRLAAEEDFIS